MLFGLVIVGAWVVWDRLHSDYPLRTLTFAYLAFLIGKTAELRKITGDWWSVVKILGCAAIFSMIVFLPTKGGPVRSFEEQLESIPILFALSSLIATSAFYREKLTSEIGEGISLLHSLALLYYLLELARAGTISPMWLIPCIVPAAWAITHALTKIDLGLKDRLWLSLWSSLISLIFGVVYLLRVLEMDNVEQLVAAGSYLRAAIISSDFFLLGASGVYLLQNAMMLLLYIPGRNNLGSGTYMAQVENLNRQHIRRFSSDQVDRRDALFALILVGGMFIANYFFQLTRPEFVVWLSLVVAPVLIGIFSRGFKKE